MFLLQSTPLLGVLFNQPLHGVVVRAKLVRRLFDHFLHRRRLLLLNGLLLFGLLLRQAVEFFLLFPLQFDKLFRRLQLIECDRLEFWRVVLFVLVPGR